VREALLLITTELVVRAPKIRVQNPRVSFEDFVRNLLSTAFLDCEVSDFFAYESPQPPILPVYGVAGFIPKNITLLEKLNTELLIIRSQKVSGFFQHVRNGSF